MLQCYEPLSRFKLPLAASLVDQKDSSLFPAQACEKRGLLTKEERDDGATSTEILVRVSASPLFQSFPSFSLLKPHFQLVRDLP